jgi:hypothetical protein
MVEGNDQTIPPSLLFCSIHAETRRRQQHNPLVVEFRWPGKGLCIVDVVSRRLGRNGALVVAWTAGQSHSFSTYYGMLHKWSRGVSHYHRRSQRPLGQSNHILWTLTATGSYIRIQMVRFHRDTAPETQRWAFRQVILHRTRGYLFPLSDEQGEVRQARP